MSEGQAETAEEESRTGYGLRFAKAPGEDRAPGAGCAEQAG
ncbi:hypothetical protein [uncultured Acetatifactor sp.]|nr:hypothetical protein [uncultured Acetatifactor sp.]